MAISQLVDEPDNVMNFGVDEVTTDEAKSWLQLVNVDDQPGGIDDLKNASAEPQRRLGGISPTRPVQTKSSKSTRGNSSKIISIEEVDEDEESDVDLIAYQKPDEDPPDSDEDPTLINRSKPRAPVYIADLVKALRTNSKPDVTELALKTAPWLIRRKAGFGAELAENIEDLASALITLQEGMSEDTGHQLRLQSLIACLVALPKRMGPWLASMYFEGDFSLSQRASLLTAIGLGARELAGYEDDQEFEPRGGVSFPSRRLPPTLAAIYAPVDSLSRQIEHSVLQPMALAAADKLTGPDILKVRTFSSRMEVEKKSKQKAMERQTKIPKDLHKILSNSIIFPLCSRMSILLCSRPNHNSILFEPPILRHFLQTLTILITTLGPHAIQLADVTRETLLLLVNLHVIYALSTDAAVLPALLQLLLTVLDINSSAGPAVEEKLVADLGGTVTELVAWAGALGRNVNVPETGVEEGTPWTALAAGVQVKWHEVGRKFQGRMLGLTLDEMDAM